MADLLAMNASNATASRLPSDVLVDTGSKSGLGLLGMVVLAAMKVVPSSLLFAITFITITVPTWIYWFFSASLTVTVNFTYLAIIFIVIASSVGYYFRYRFHTYTRLPAEPTRREAEAEIFPVVARVFIDLSYLTRFLYSFSS